jgi:hypothetical protein
VRQRAEFALVVAIAACARPPGATERDSSDRRIDEHSAPASATSPRPERPLGPDALPEIAGFTASPVSRGDDWFRRTYARGRARITVTIGQFKVDDLGYERWVRQSRDAYPQADLGLPEKLANGFYECAGGDPPACNLLVQLRSGAHIEIRGDGTAARADVDDIAAGLPLRALATAPVDW